MKLLNLAIFSILSVISVLASGDLRSEAQQAHLEAQRLAILVPDQDHAGNPIWALDSIRKIEIALNAKTYRSRYQGWEFPSEARYEAKAKCLRENSDCTIQASYLDLNENWHAIAIPLDWVDRDVVGHTIIASTVLGYLMGTEISQEAMQLATTLRARLSQIGASQAQVFRSNPRGHSNPRASKIDAEFQCHQRFARCSEAWTSSHYDSNTQKWHSITKSDVRAQD